MALYDFNSKVFYMSMFHYKLYIKHLTENYFKIKVGGREVGDCIFFQLAIFKIIFYQDLSPLKSRVVAMVKILTFCAHWLKSKQRDINPLVIALVAKHREEKYKSSKITEKKEIKWFG